jgi:dTDP-4-dehydrorhamnose reductase
VSKGRPTILLLGARGQLGRELAAILPAHGDLVARHQGSLDITDASVLGRTVRSLRPRFIVNAAAYTAVDRAEGERDKAYAVNADAPAVMAALAREVDAVLIHYSTDYVIDGMHHVPYTESDEPRPINVYGASKLAGEQAIAASGAAALTLRTSWVYARHGQNFVMTMQRLAQSRDEIRVVNDQFGVPNWARALARATAELIARGSAVLAERAGLYHLSAGGSTSWYEFARTILEGRNVRVLPISTADYPTAAARPRYGVLDTGRFNETFGFALPDWRASLHACLAAPAEPAATLPVN